MIKYFEILSILIIFLFLIFSFIYLKKGPQNKNFNNLGINLIVYFIVSIVMIRAAPRQFVTYYPIYFITLVFIFEYLHLFFLKKKI